MEAVEYTDLRVDRGHSTRRDRHPEAIAIGAELKPVCLTGQGVRFCGVFLDATPQPLENAHQ